MSKQTITLIAAAAILYIIFNRKKCVSSSVIFEGPISTFPGGTLPRPD